MAERNHLPSQAFGDAAPALRGGTASLTIAALHPFTRQLDTLPSDVRASLVERTQALLAHANMSALDLIDPEARIPLHVASELLVLAESATGPGLGLRAAEGAVLGDLGVFEFVARTCRTLGEAIETACHYRRLMYDGADLKLVIETDSAKIRYRLHDRIASRITFVEFALTACVVASRRALGFAGSPREVRFTHAEPAYASEYARVFQAPVRFRASHDEIVFGRRALDFPLASADPATHLIFKRYADRLLDMLPTSLPITRSVQRLVRERIDAQQPAHADLAAALHMSERTLRRKLTQEGVQLRELIEQTRREQACRYLASSSLSVSEIAYRLGFSHPPAFHRAFRRWLGVSPLQYRREHAASPVYRYFAPPAEAAETEPAAPPPPARRKRGARRATAAATPAGQTPI
jgi:AraC-like DNA-binding protein